MSLITVEHQNPKRVTNRLNRWSEIFGSNLIIKTLEKQMDITYEAVYKSAPVRTGYLRSTIQVTSGKDFTQIAVTAYYAYYVSEGISAGGRRRVPNPFWKANIAGLSLETIAIVRNLFQGNF